MASDHREKSTLNTNDSALAKQDTQDQSDSPQVVIEFQGLSKQALSSIWEELKQGVIPEGAAYTAARSMLDHQHWYAFYETIGIFDMGDDAYPGNVDPFLHVNLHFLIGLQILTANPPGAQSFYLTREKQGDEPHEVVHVMMEAFQRHLVWTAIHGGPEGQFDMKAYEDTLEVLQGLNRNELWERLGHDEPPTLHPEAHQHLNF